MPDKFSQSHEVAQIGRDLIKQHHQHLSTRRVEFLFVTREDSKGVSQAITRKGKSLYGQAKLVTGLNAFLAADDLADEHRPFFVILISKHFWHGMTKEHKEALVDHELSHCWYDSQDDKYSMVEHDVTEFTAIVRRHGAWNTDLDLFFKAAKQIKLPLAEAVTEPPAEDAKAKVVKAGNGKADAAPAPEPPANQLGSIKDHVAQKRGKAPVARA